MNKRMSKKGILVFVSAMLIASFLLVVVSLPSRVTFGTSGYDVPLDSRWMEIDNEFTPAIAPWDWQMLGADYHLRVKEDFTAGQIIEFEFDGSTVQFQPMGLEWSNSLSQIQPISIPQDVIPVVTNPEVDMYGTIKHQGTIVWNDAYGSNIDFEWKSTPTILNKTLTISSLSDLPVPEEYIINGGSPFLRLNLIFDPSTDLDIYVDNDMWDKQTKVQTFNDIEFRKDGQTLWSIIPLLYWDSSEVPNEGQSVATLEKSGNKLYISVRVPYSWLQDATYPVYVDADVTVDSGVSTTFYVRALRSGIFWTSPTVGYIVNLSGVHDLEYNKTSDGGANWDGAVPIKTCNAVSYDCYADWQTAGDAGTKIHIAYMSRDTGEVRYVYLDTSDDSVGGDDLIETCQGSGIFYTVPDLLYFQISITKTRGSNFAVAFKYWDDNLIAHNSFYTSPNADAWTSEVSPYTDEASPDHCILFPANLADNQDVWGVYWDDDADEISLKTYDDSGNSWSEQLISGSMVRVGYMQMDGAIRLSDGHLLLVAWSQYDNAAADLMTWDITDNTTITAKTNVLTNSAESMLVSVFVNQDNDDWYVTYARGGTASSLTTVYYKKSTDGGDDWATLGELAMQANAQDDERWISCGAVKATWGGKFQPVWFNDDLNDIFTNADNGISIPAAGGCSPNIDNSPISKEYGIVAENSAYETGLTNFTVTNNSGELITITIQATDWSGGNGWTLSDTATPGVDIAGLKAGVEGEDYTIVVKKTGPYNTLVSGLADEATQKWGLKLYTPTSHSDGVEKSSIVTLTATCD